MANKGIHNELVSNNVPYSISATNYSFEVLGVRFSFEFETAAWVEFLTDGSFRNVSAEYVHQVVDEAISKMRSVR